MATRDELRVRLQADVTPYAGQMQVAERATKAVVDQTKQWRDTALKSSGVAAGLSESLVVLTGSSTAAARGLTAVNVASKALALTPAGAAMTALGLVVGVLVDKLSEVPPEAEKAEDAVVSLATRVDWSADLIKRQNEELATMRQRVSELNIATDDLAAGEEASLRRRSEELQKRARAQSEEIERVRELTGRFSDQATQELRVGEALAEYLETEKELAVVTKQLGEIRERERQARAKEAQRLREQQEKELANVIQMAQRRTDAAVKAAQTEEQARQALVERQVEQLRSQIQTAEERLALEQEIADKLYEQGNITEEEHRKRMRQIDAERMALDHRWKDFDKRLEDARKATEEQSEKLKERVTMIRDITNDLISAGVDTLFEEWKKDLEGAEKVAAELLQTVAQIAQQALVAKIGSSALAGAGGGGGNWPRFASGGLIRGPGTGTSDSIVARVSAGEYVVRAAAVEKVGVGLLEAINNFQMPRFASGGQVGGGGGDVRVTVPVMRTDDEMARFLSSRPAGEIITKTLRDLGLV